MTSDTPTTTPDTKTSMHRIVDALKIETYEDKDQVLKAAIEAGFGSREKVYMAIVYAYQWYYMSHASPAYMMQKFDGHDPEIKPAAGDTNLFAPTIKLVFNFIESQYASRVHEYALVLQYIHTKMDPALYEEDAYSPQIALQIIKEGGGIRQCANKQKEINNPAPTGQATKQQVAEFLQKACTTVYANKAPLTTIDLKKAKVEIPESSSDFVLMMGRKTNTGDMEIVEIFDAGPEQIYSLTKERALNDTSNVSPTINILADTLGFIDAFGTKAETIVTVDAGGDAVRLSLNNEADVSMVVTATPKDTSNFGGFNKRGVFSLKDRDWFMDNAQSRASRRLYDLTASTSKGKAIASYDMINQASAGKTKLDFQAITAATKGQVALEDINNDDWVFSIDLDRSQMVDLYSWTKGWLGTKRPNAASRIIPITVEDGKITLDGMMITEDGGETGGSEDKVLTLNTGVAKNTYHKYRVFGREFVKVIEQLMINPDITTLTFRALASGLIELVGSDNNADYTIDIPTVLKGDMNHNPKRFCKLAA